MKADQIAGKILEQIGKAVEANQLQVAHELSCILVSILQARDAGL